jgi:hypothetical protein
MATQDDLAALFSRNLSLQNTYVAPAEEPSHAEAPIVYSISQHYHHSAHIASQQPSRPASEPPQTDQFAAEIILSRHGVDVNSLSPSQLELFKTADVSQQMRLVELWRISPPGYGGHALTHGLVNMPNTSFEQEEAMAVLRYERQMTEERLSRAGGEQHAMDSESTMSDESGTIPMPMTPIQGGDVRWSSPEPYMASGYEILAQRDYDRSTGPSKDIYSHFGTSIGGPTYNPATDPVYNSTPDTQRYSNVSGDWAQLMEQRRQVMENQYGAFSQFQHSEGAVVTGQYSGQDEEML